MISGKRKGVCSLFSWTPRTPGFPNICQNFDFIFLWTAFNPRESRTEVNKDSQKHVFVFFGHHFYIWGGANTSLKHPTDRNELQTTQEITPSTVLFPNQIPLQHPHQTYPRNRRTNNESVTKSTNSTEQSPSFRGKRESRAAFKLITFKIRTDAMCRFVLVPKV